MYFFNNEKESTQTSVIGFVELSNQMYCKESHLYYLDQKLYLIVLCYICKQFEQAFDMKART